MLDKAGVKQLRNAEVARFAKCKTYQKASVAVDFALLRSASLLHSYGKRVEQNDATRELVLRKGFAMPTLLHKASPQRADQIKISKRSQTKSDQVRPSFKFCAGDESLQSTSLTYSRCRFCNLLQCAINMLQHLHTEP